MTNTNICMLVSVFGQQQAPLSPQPVSPQGTQNKDMTPKNSWVLTREKCSTTAMIGNLSAPPAAPHVHGQTQTHKNAHSFSPQFDAFWRSKIDLSNDPFLTAFCLLREAPKTNPLTSHIHISPTRDLQPISRIPVQITSCGQVPNLITINH